jgi:ubiquinone/menaquinone biosynthesis C-methylase UbiE
VQTSANDIRPVLHGMWASVAPAWQQHADHADARAATATERMLDLSALEPGHRVLELACGPGGLGLAAAKRVGDHGEVVMSDVVPEMTAIAAARAEALGLENVATRVLDLERIDEPDESYDAVLCREGLMFTLDPARAARELSRVLRPGGRLTIAVWAARERNPWLGIVLDAASAQLGAPVPPPGIPGPFALADAARLERLLGEAPFAEVNVASLEVPMQAGSFEEWWERTCALAGPLAKVLAALPPEAASALRERAREAARPYETQNGLEFPGCTLLASARRD